MRRTVPRLDGAARDAARGELIGRPVRVSASTDPGLVGLAGTVVDETLRTLVLRLPEGREVRLGKRGTTFELQAGPGPVQVPGAAIEFRPQERTKKVR